MGGGGGNLKYILYVIKWLVGQKLVSKIDNFTNKLLTHVSRWLVRQILVSKINNKVRVLGSNGTHRKVNFQLHFYSLCMPSY